MLSVKKEDLDKITEVFYRLLKGKKPAPVSLPEDYPDNEVRQAVGYINKFLKEYSNITDVIFKFSQGEIDLEIHKSGMSIPQSLKHLQANLRHLTWTTQQIAKGDFGQRISFLGDFAEAFNSMTEQLQESFRERNIANETLQIRVSELAKTRLAMLNIMEDLSGKNEELTESEKQIRVAKEQAEEASEALQLRVDELAEARRAMLNVMEDLGEANREIKMAHRQILDSIQYASRIQRSLLPGESLLRQVFPQCMVIWEPRDVVGGDIYWCRAWGEGHLLILGDCTGHGVPGAFMTLIANGALDHAMQEAAPGDAAGLIGHMHRLMQTWLGQDTGEGNSDDGIELGACYIPPDRQQIVFAGARFSLFHINDGVVAEVSGDKKGIGFRGIPHQVAFTNRLVEVAPKRCFFLTTDGMIDQVGGEKRRGFGKKRFGRLVASLAHIPLRDQGRYFLQELAGYQGEEKRRDDVSIIGFSLEK